MPTITREQVKVPVDVLPEARETYIDNYLAATRNTGRLMLFACDQKVEHLNGDFFGEGISPDDADPEHLFKIASQGVCGVMAAQRGLVARYGADYPDINYLVKMNSKSNLVKTASRASSTAWTRSFPCARPGSTSWASVTPSTWAPTTRPRCCPRLAS